MQVYGFIAKALNLTAAFPFHPHTGQDLLGDRLTVINYSLSTHEMMLGFVPTMNGLLAYLNPSLSGQV